MSKFLLIFAAGLLATFGALAQDSSQPAPSTPSAKHKQMRGDRAEQRLKRLSKKLSLTDEQKEKARPIVQDEEKQLSALESDSTLTPQQKHKKTREIRMASRAQLDSILTDEQKAKLPSHAGGRGERHHQKSGEKPGASTQPGSDQTQQ
jgi:Spy/CpxP family protein refolding chaperone